MDAINKDLSSQGLIPELLRGQSLQFNLAPSRVPVDHVGVQVPPELLEARPFPVPEELVLEVAEHLLRGAVVDAVAPARHALHDPGPPERARPARVLVLPAHIGMQDRVPALGHLGPELGENVVLLGHVGAERRRPRDDLLAAEVVDRREVGLAPGMLELGDVGPHLLPRAVRLEVPADHVLEGLADLSPVRAVPVVVGLAAYPAAYPHLAHDLEHGLVCDDGPALGAQAHGDLAMAAAVGGPGEDLGDLLPELRPGGRTWVRQRVVVARSGQSGGPQQVGEGVVPRKLAHGRGLLAVRERFSAFRAIDFFR